jgi:hypothetical protein
MIVAAEQAGIYQYNVPESSGLKILNQSAFRNRASRLDSTVFPLSGNIPEGHFAAKGSIKVDCKGDVMALDNS